MRANVTSEKAQKALGIVWFRLDPATRRELAGAFAACDRRPFWRRNGTATVATRARFDTNNFGEPLQPWTGANPANAKRSCYPPYVGGRPPRRQPTTPMRKN